MCRTLVGVQFRVKTLSRDFRYIAAQTEEGWEISRKHERAAFFPPLLHLLILLFFFLTLFSLPTYQPTYLSTWPEELTRRLFPPPTRFLRDQRD